MKQKFQTEADARRDAAARALWSNHPLIAAYRKATGKWDVSLKALIRFTVALPQDQFNACMFGAGVRDPRRAS
jgi:hypothetical protein